MSHAVCSTVSVADGNQLEVRGKVDKFKWEFHGSNFQADFMVIPLGNCDVVLGVQWSVTLGDITWNLQKLEMSFVTGHKKVLLHGIKQGSVREVKTLKFNKKQESQVQILMIYAQTRNKANTMQLESNENTSVSPIIKKLQEEYAYIFEEPAALPPFRENHNHKILSKKGLTLLIKERPYQYAVHQKTEIDKKSSRICYLKAPFRRVLVLMLLLSF